MKLDYRSDLLDVAEALNDLMADLEDIRDDAQDQQDEEESPEIAADLKWIDAVLAKLNEAADLLENE